MSGQGLISIAILRGSDGDRMDVAQALDAAGFTVTELVQLRA